MSGFASSSSEEDWNEWQLHQNFSPYTAFLAEECFSLGKVYQAMNQQFGFSQPHIEAVIDGLPGFQLMTFPRRGWRHDQMEWAIVLRFHADEGGDILLCFPWIDVTPHISSFVKGVRVYVLNNPHHVTVARLVRSVIDEILALERKFQRDKHEQQYQFNVPMPGRSRRHVNTFIMKHINNVLQKGNDWIKKREALKSRRLPKK